MRKPKILRKLKRPRINAIIGKKQIIVTGLTLLLGVAIYVNYIYASTANTPENLILPENEEVRGVYYGDAAFVSMSNSPNISDEVRAYFTQARMDLQESRDEAKEFLEAMFSGGDARGEALEVMARNAERLSNNIESETRVENLLKAQGFADALVYISDRGVNIIVKTDGLDAAGAAAIKSTLLSEVSVAAENITIVEIN
ncbi:MAG: SpoIIIAH-like family protein [Oscillospiraceae bacterium]|jgi:stage III sporulation protein AH|nr:SpoIIIAH-like family protein [Oscillospiraceae bacterium]